MLEPRCGRGDLRRCVQEKKQTDRLWATRSMCKDASWRLLAISVAENALVGTEMSQDLQLYENPPRLDEQHVDRSRYRTCVTEWS